MARFQPIHNGHIALIEKAIKENDQVLILIGSADKLNSRNPIPIKLRRELVQKVIDRIDIDHKCIIEELVDLSTESDNSIEWGFYLYANVVEITGQTKFTIYYSDGFEIITKWFPGHILYNYVSLSLLARGATKNGISATQVRELIRNNNELLKKCTPDEVYSQKELLKIYLSFQK